MADETYTVERSAVMSAPPERIYEQIADFHNWPHWSPWEGLDPDMRRTYSGPSSGTSAAYSWSGNRRAGQGRMEIRSASAPSTVDIDLAFEKPFKSRSDTVFTIAQEGPEASRVTWTMTGKKTLVTKVMGVFKSMDAMIGPDFEKGLAQLKSVVEHPAID
jgi:uncharacterized protein YndB with AHSA1/START domain